jgi:general secretion pathway protein D
MGGSGAGAGVGSSGSMGSGTRTASVNLAEELGGDPVMDEVRVVADDQNNSLMIYANRRQYRIIEAALERLDQVPTQVIIEASIMEVRLTDELRYGLEWTFKNGIGSDYDGFGQLVNQGTQVGAIVPGFSYTVTNSVGDISAVLNALSQDSLLNVISTPSVMVLDNNFAYIHVGDQVPFSTGATTTDGGTTTERIQYRDTGVRLNVRPSVNAGGLITMDVEQSVTDIGNIDAATGQRTFLERNIVSRVAVRSNESVVLGGLIRESANEASSGVPLLHKLPVVGGLFGTIDEDNIRTELLVIITPRAIYNESELRAVSDEMRGKVRNMELLQSP